MTGTDTSTVMPDHDRAALAVLTALDHLGPKRLEWVLAFGSPATALDALRAGRLPSRRAPVGVNQELVDRWRAALRAIDPDDFACRHADAGIALLAPGDPDWPLVDDPEPPRLLYVRGSTEKLRRRPDMPVVAVVGTRRCSSIGRRVATELGHDLTSAGVAVVSGLALGIDGAAHKGALRAVGGAAPIGVVATGLDVPYPRSHTDLWSDIARRGALVSEWPLGTPAARWRFPARNRIIAGLADLVIVVESHSKGGALLTVDEAMVRSVDVLAVPGSVLSRSSEGTNQLLMDGCAPVRSASDVLELLGLTTPTPAPAPQLSLAIDGERVSAAVENSVMVPAQERISGGPLAEGILAELTAGSSTIDHLVLSTESSLSDVLEMVQYLELDGLVLLDGAVVALVDGTR